MPKPNSYISTPLDNDRDEANRFVKRLKDEQQSANEAHRLATDLSARD